MNSDSTFKVFKNLKQANAATGRFGAVDGLRALAIIGVILFHTRPVTLSGGFIGVTIFFVLSGYFAMRTLLRADKTFSWLGYVWQRLKRIWPSILVLIVLTMIASWLVSPSLLPKTQSDVAPSAFFFSNWSYILREVSYFDNAGLPSPLKHLWYVSLIMQAFVVWSLIFAVARHWVKTRRGWLLVSSALVVASLAVMFGLSLTGQDATSRIYYGLDTRAGEFLVGVTLATIIGPRQCRKVEVREANKIDLASSKVSGLLRSMLGLLAVAILIAAFFLVDGAASWLPHGGYLLFALVSAVAMWACLSPNTWFAKALSFEPLSYLGTRSFALYLVHFPILLMFNPATRTTDIGIPERVLHAAIILVAAELLYQLMERPKGMFKKPKSIATVRISAIVVCALLTLAFAFVSIDWKGAAEKRAIELRPELAATPTPTPIPTPTEVAPKPVAAQVPSGLDASDWKIDSATGTCQTPVTLVGDSVLLGAQPQLQEVLPNSYVDGKVSRSVFEGPAVYQQAVANGSPGKVVVYALGTNGPIFDDDLLQGLVDSANGLPVYFLTLRVPQAHQDPSNDALWSYVSSHPNVGLLDWFSLTKDHPEYLADDGIHLTPAGSQAYSNMILRGICV
ncbi:acyltransferase family protein [Propionimicrobium sp. BV2F7]|uniref:acyltransferase family protein n=1 Tax=Propionimicrobium sp. BV2F7 TaxID=1111131 RepID=UPI0003D796B6|nr:acyltransferase family protein [Propionimicrobium sp. BV2F7]ETJ97422.1 acyltransferase [Propionimicrobium sp. BV2F7]